MIKALKHVLGVSFLISVATATFGTAAPNSQPSAPPAPATTPAAGQPAAINPSGTSPTQYRDVAQASREYHLKGAFLRYVAKYVIYPATALEGSNINLCVLGQVPVFQGIESIDGKVVNDRTIKVSKLLDLNDAKNQHCQIVFVAKTETDRLKDIINYLKNEPILSFGDMDAFAPDGGNMNFYIANNHLAIMTNMPAVQQSKLNLDPEMLKLVTFVPKTT